MTNTTQFSIMAVLLKRPIIRKIKIVNKSNNPLPKYSKKGDSGMDVMAYIQDGNPITLKPGERVSISTGLYVEIPSGFEIQVRSRSGLAINDGLVVLNSPGTVDSGYRGEIKVILYNSSSVNDKIINSGDRIAQLVLMRVPRIRWTEVTSLDEESDRGSEGFGSTGV